MRNHKKVIPFRHVVAELKATQTPRVKEEPWRFFDYAESSKSAIETWYDGLSENGLNIFETMLSRNADTPLPLAWNNCTTLKGKYKGLWEWRFFDNGRQQRLIGIFGEHKKAIFLIGCDHKQKIYVPPNCLDTALTRAEAIRKGAAINERKIEKTL